MNAHLLIERLERYADGKALVNVHDLLMDCRMFLLPLPGQLQKAAEQEQKCHSTLRECEHEILGLRRQNELLRAKVEVMDLFAQVLNTKPAERCQSAAPDVIFQIVKRLEGM